MLESGISLQVRGKRAQPTHSGVGSVFPLGAAAIIVPVPDDTFFAQTMRTLFMAQDPFLSAAMRSVRAVQLNVRTPRGTLCLSAAAVITVSVLPVIAAA